MITHDRCSARDCDNASKYRGYCERHYRRLLRHGDPLGGCALRGAADEFIRTASDYDGDDCLLWPFKPDNKGYGRVRRHGKSVLAHRVVCEIVHGHSKLLAAHSCGSGHLGCITPRHLRWATHQENSEDMIRHGRSAACERNGRARLTPDDVAAIKSMEGTETKRVIGERFGIHESHVYRVLRGTAWAKLNERI